MNNKDYYKIMGVQRDANEKEIKMAYRRLARKYHPDISKEPNAEAQFKEVGEAYEVLKDPEKRKTYDQYLRDCEHAQTAREAYGDRAGFGASDHGASYQFDPEFFESIFGQRFQQPPSAGADYQANMTVTLEEAYHGGVKEIHLPGSGRSPQVLRVKIPAGVTSGQQIRLAGQGAVSLSGGARGDLYLTVHIEKHRLFDLKGRDVYLTLPVTPWEAALGANIVIPTLGGEVDLKIPAGSQGGQTMRLKKRGMPGSTPGDQYLILKVMIPKPQDDDAKALYQKMSEIMPFNPRAQMRI